MKQEILKCGCERGSFLCLEAERLWREVGIHYENGDWKKYEESREKYEQHFRR